MTGRTGDAIADVDVAVVGLGTVGSMALWQLSERPGLSVLGIEQFGLGHTHGSFTGESRLFRVAYKEGARYVPLLLKARALWRELAERTGRDLFLDVGALSIGSEDRQEMQETLHTIREFDLPHRLLDAAELHEAYPQFSPRPDDIGIVDLQGGGLRPELSVLGALSLAAANGAETLTNTETLSIEDEGDHVLVRTTQGAVRAGRVIVTAGSWTTRVLPSLSDLVTVHPLVLTWFVPRHPERFDGAHFPVFMRDVGDIHFFGAPSLDGWSLKVSPGGRYMDWADSLDALPTSLPRRELIRLGAQAASFIPDLVPEPVRVQIHHDSFTPDRIPVLDRSDDGRIVTISGLSGHGFKFAPVFGRLAASLAVDGGSDDWDPLYSVDAARRRADGTAPLG